MVQGDGLIPKIKFIIKKLQLFFFIRIMGKKPVHFLHINKTAGTSIKVALNRYKFSGKYSLILHDHDTTLNDIPQNEKIFFFLRDPVSRFISGFNTRLREGYPRNKAPHSSGEKTAFNQFLTPNELALALSSENDQIKKAACEAMEKIGHVKTKYWDWFDAEETLLRRREDILFLGYQETFAEDFNRLVKKLGFTVKITFPQNDIDTHRTPPNMSKRIDPEAIENLKKWYFSDYHFIKICKSLNIDC
jgi:Sulfotransferase family